MLLIDQGKYKGYEFCIDKEILYVQCKEDKIEVRGNIEYVSMNFNKGKYKKINKNNVRCKFSLNNEECEAVIPFEIYICLIMSGLK